MQRHGAEMRDLVLGVILMDDDRAARAAGEIYDEPMLARPVGGDELNGLLPERFFALQDELEAGARRLVTALARKDRGAIGDDLALLTKSCIACHEVYLGASAAPPPGP
jgi:mono/diheme cytochrome c family protein